MPNIDLQVVIDAVDNASKTIAGVAGSIENMGKNMAVIGAAPAAALAYATTRATAFEKSMANVATVISGDSTEAIKGLSDQVLSLSKTLPQTPDDLSAGLYDILSAGVQGADNQMKVLEGSAKLATAGLGTTGEAVDITTSALAAFNLPASDAAKITDVLFKTVSVGKTTVAQLAQSFGATAPVIAAAGVKLEDFQAATAALTTTGQPASQAQNSLRQAIVSLTKPTKEMSELFTKMGVTGLPEMIKKGKSMGDIFVDLNKAADNNAETLTKAFGSVEAYGAALGLSTTVNRAYVSALNDMNGGVNTLDEAFNKQTKTVAAQSAILKNNLDTVAISIGSTLLPMLNSALQAVIPLIEKFSTFASENPKLVATVLGVGAAIGVIGGAILILTPIVTAIIGIFTTLWTVITVGAGIVGTIVAILGGPLTLAIIAIGVAVAAFTMAWQNNWFGIRDTLQAAWVNIQNLLTKFAPYFNVVFTAVAKAIIGPLAPAIQWIYDNFNAVMNVINKVKDAANSAISAAQNALSFGNTPKRASGGPVSSATPVLVGERGPEMFVPPSAGAIIPNSQMGNGGKQNIYINVNAELKGEMDIDRLVERLQFAISKQGYL